MADTKRILIIDDDPDIRESVKVVLEANDYEAFSAQNGSEGIQMALDKKPDLIICDMMMESIDSGSTVAAKLKEQLPAVPVFLFSSIGNATAANIEVDKLGFQGVLQKPVAPELLLNTLKKALNQ